MTTEQIILRDRHGNERAVVLVDAADHEDLAVYYSWHLTSNGYAARTNRAGSRPRAIYMHRQILGLESGKGAHEVDHVNGNRLDNRRANLRLVTRAQNTQNRRLDRRSSSGHKNVSFHKQSGLWVVQVRANNVVHYGGCFRDLDAAAEHAKVMRARHQPFAVEARL